MVDAVFVNKWFQYPRGEAADLRIEVLRPGQRVRLIDGEKIVAEALSDENRQVKIAMPTGASLQGFFEITAPDGETVVFRSPRYAELTAGDAFSL